MTYLSADQILNAKDIETREVEVPEWGGVVLVRGLSGLERDAYEQSLTMIRGKEHLPNLTNARAKLVSRAVVDENGERLFTDRQVNALGEKSSIALTRIFEVVAEMSGMTDESVEDAEGNSEVAQTGDSTSD